MTLSEKNKGEVLSCVATLKSLLPEGWQLGKAFSDAEDDFEFDTDPSVNYDTGRLVGMADMAGVSVSELLRAAGVDPAWQRAPE